jgi:Type II/IV secretion system protein
MRATRGGDTATDGGCGAHHVDEGVCLPNARVGAAVIARPSSLSRSQLPCVNQVETHTKIGLDFARGLRTILRSDPDVLLIGEIRDAVARLKNMGVDPALLAASLHRRAAPRAAALRALP